MPFRKIGPDTYVSESGNKFTGPQYRLYQTNNGFPKKKKKPKSKMRNRKSKR
tara:strand:+ start:343 stop:498 length:156 start_codon:yes stop_codon:yes gene_type:complete